MNRKRLFLGLADHGCRLYALSLGFRAKGWKSLYYSFYPEPNGADAYRPTSELPYILRLHHKFGALRSDPKIPVALRRLSSVLNELMRLPLLFWVVLNFDVFIFGPWNSFFFDPLGGRTRAPLWILKAEAWLFRVTNKKLIYTFSGGDSRPTYIDGMYIHGESWSLERVRTDVAWQCKQLALINKIAHAIVDIPPQGQYFQSRRFVLHSKLGLPYLPAKNAKTPPANPPESEKVIVLHTPSDPMRKGTALVESMVAQLQSEGFPIEYKSATGISRLEVLELMQSSDIFFDEAYSDFPASCTTVEAACNGAAPVSCGYSAEFWARLEPEMTRALGQMKETDVLPYVRSLLQDRAKLLLKRKEAREFIEKNWSIEQVTDRYIRLIEGDVPEDWYYDPASAEDVQGGFFMPVAKARSFLSEYLRRFGVDALQIDDKPVLRDALENFAKKPQS